MPASRSRSQPRSPRRRRPDEVRALLLEAAAAAFAERGFHGATTKDVADRAGVAEPLLFRHFGSKSGLFLEAALHPFAEIVAEEVRAYDSQRQRPRSNFEIMRDFIGRAYDVFRENRRLVASLVAASESEDPAVTRLSELPGLVEHFDRLEQVGREAAAAHDMATLDTEVTSRALTAMAFAMAVFDPWFRVGGRNGKEKRDRIVDGLTRLALYGTEYQARAIREGKSPAPARPKAPRRQIRGR